MDDATGILVVIPTHDRLAMLEVALNSVLMQTLQPTAVVVSDDTADSRVKALAESVVTRVPVHYVTVDEAMAGTAGASRNAGAAARASRYVAFLDDDDRWDPTFLESAIDVLESQGVDLAVVWSRLERDGRLLDPPPQMPDQVVLDRVRAVNPGFVGSNFVIRRSVFARIGGFDDTLPVFNDLDLLVRFIESGGSYAVVHEELVTQASHGGDQLSLRGARRARGIRHYMSKHGGAADRAARRRLRRELYVAERYPGRGLLVSGYFFVQSWLAAEPVEVVHAVERRIRRVPRAYG